MIDLKGCVSAQAAAAMRAGRGPIACVSVCGWSQRIGIDGWGLGAELVWAFTLRTTVQARRLANKAFLLVSEATPPELDTPC